MIHIPTHIQEVKKRNLISFVPFCNFHQPKNKQVENPQGLVRKPAGLSLDLRTESTFLPFKLFIHLAVPKFDFGENKLNQNLVFNSFSYEKISILTDLT